MLYKSTLLDENTNNYGHAMIDGELGMNQIDQLVNISEVATNTVENAQVLDEPPRPVSLSSSASTLSPPGNLINYALQDMNNINLDSFINPVDQLDIGGEVMVPIYEDLLPVAHEDTQLKENRITITLGKDGHVLSYQEDEEKVENSTDTNKDNTDPEDGTNQNVENPATSITPQPNKRKSIEIPAEGNEQEEEMVQHPVSAITPPAKIQKCLEQIHQVEYEEHVPKKTDQIRGNTDLNKFTPLLLEQVEKVQKEGQFSIINMQCSADCQELLSNISFTQVPNKYIRKIPAPIDGYLMAEASLEIGEVETLNLISNSNYKTICIQRLVAVTVPKSKLTGIDADSQFYTEIQRMVVPHQCVHSNTIEFERQIALLRMHEASTAIKQYTIPSLIFGSLTCRGQGFCRALKGVEETKHFTPATLRMIQNCEFINSKLLGSSCNQGPHELFTLLNSLPYQLMIINTSHSRFLNGTIRELADDVALAVYGEHEVIDILHRNSKLNREQSHFEVAQVCLPLESLYSGTNTWHEIIFTNGQRSYVIQPAMMMCMVLRCALRNQLFNIV
jgi:hypothetical protein